MELKLTQVGKMDYSSVTEYKFLLFTIRQAKNKVLGQGIVTLFGKLADREDGQLLTQRSWT